MTTAPVLRAYRRSDEASLSELYARAFGPLYRTHFLRRWEWEFQTGPALRRFENLVAEHDGEVLAHLGRLPTRLAVDDAILPAAFLTDLVADGRRGGVVSLRLVTSALAELPVALVFGAQEHVMRVYNRLGMRSVPIGEILMRVERPDGVLAAACYRLLSRRFPSARGLARRWLFAPAALAGLVLTARRRRLSPSGYRVEEVTSVDTRFDELWEAMRRDCPVMCVHDAAFLRWRYLESPTGSHRILALFDEQGTLAAASVLGRIALGPATYGKLMECLYRDEAALAAMLDASIATFRWMGVDFIISIGLSQRTRQLLRRAGFSRAGRTRAFAAGGSLRDGARLLDPARWYVSAGDGDDDFEETITAPRPDVQRRLAS